MVRRIGFLWGAIAATWGCRPAPAAELNPPPTIESVEPARPSIGLSLTVTGAPAGTTVKVEASDRRTPLVSEQPLTSSASFETPKGFITVTLRSGQDVRVLEFFAERTAQVVVAWKDPGVLTGTDIIPLDRSAALQQAKENLDALMAHRKDEAQMVATLLEQRAAIDAMGRSPGAYLARLLHATMAVQIRGPQDAWTVIEPIPADSIAWAAFSERMLELRVLFYGLPEADARFTEVRALVEDVGLQAAFRAGDLLAREKAKPDDGEPHTSMTLAGPPEVGQTMPGFVLADLDDGNPLTNADLAGTPYLVELWSTWCEPCLETMDALQALHFDAGADRLRIVSVAVNGEKEPVEEFRKTRWPMPWTNVWAPSGAPFFDAWKIDQVPYTVLVGADGVVLLAGRRVSLSEVRTTLSIPDRVVHTR